LGENVFNSKRNVFKCYLAFPLSQSWQSSLLLLACSKTCFEFDMNVLDYSKKSLALCKVLLVLHFFTDWLNQVYIVMSFVPFYSALLDLLVIFGQNNALIRGRGGGRG